MARPKSNGPYAPLSATYYRDDAILAAGPDAELLFVRCLAFLADASSDGFITDLQMRYAVGMGLRNVQKRVVRLQEVGLIEAVEGGFVARSWLKWNKSAEEIGKYRKRDRERKASSGAEVVPYSERNPDGIQTDSRDQITTNQVTTHHITTRDAENRVDVETLCTLMADLVEANGSPRPTITAKWKTEARLLLDKDKRELDRAVNLIRWTQASTFWRGNVMSIPKFREKYDQLRLQANAELEQRRKPTRTDENLAYVASLVGEQKGISA